MAGKVRRKVLLPVFFVLKIQKNGAKYTLFALFLS
jgi:hypothetical protein